MADSLTVLDAPVFVSGRVRAYRLSYGDPNAIRWCEDIGIDPSRVPKDAEVLVFDSVRLAALRTLAVREVCHCQCFGTLGTHTKRYEHRVGVDEDRDPSAYGLPLVWSSLDEPS